MQQPLSSHHPRVTLDITAMHPWEFVEVPARPLSLVLAITDEEHRQVLEERQKQVRAQHEHSTPYAHVLRRQSMQLCNSSLLLTRAAQSCTPSKHLQHEAETAVAMAEAAAAAEVEAARRVEEEYDASLPDDVRAGVQRAVEKELVGGYRRGRMRVRPARNSTMGGELTVEEVVLCSWLGLRRRPQLPDATLPTDPSMCFRCNSGH